MTTTAPKTAPKTQTKYFAEAYYMYRFLEENKQYKMVKYTFTFAYGYCLQYTEKWKAEGNDPSAFLFVQTENFNF